MAKRSSKKKDRLEALREKLQNTNLGGGSRTQYFNAQEGENQIRVMPEVGNMGFFWQEVGVHYFPDKRKCYCPRIFSEGELACPICELVSDLYKAGDDDSREFASNLGVSRRFWINVISRDDEGAGPQIYTAPVSVFAYLSTLINDPDYGDITNVYEGTDVVVNKTKTGPRPRDVDYQTVARRHASPLAYDADGEPDEERIDEWLDEAKDLSWTQLPDDPEKDDDAKEGYGLWVLSYDRIVREFLEGDTDMAPAEEEEEEEVSPVQEEVTKRRARRARRRRAVE